MTGCMTFKCLVFFDSIAMSHLGPNQKSMVECFSKNSNQILAVNYFC